MFEIADTKISGNYRGLVVDNDDPDQMGRIKVQIYPHFTGIAAASLPWAVPAMPLFAGAGSSNGFFALPDVGSWVWCFFENEDPMQPVFFAEATTGAHGIPSSALGNYPDVKVIKCSGVEISIDASTGNVTISGDGTVNITGATVNVN